MCNDRKSTHKIHIGKIHQVIANRVHTFDVKNNNFDKDEPWSGILETTYSTVIIMLHSVPGQFVFIHYIILNIPFVNEWGYIVRPKQEIIDKITKIKY